MKRKIMMLGAAAMLATLAQAQTDSVTTAVLNDVTITANKMPQKQTSTGKVVTVITKEQIEKNAGKTVSQLLNEQAGITINGALNNLGSVQSVFMRGASSGRTLILMDGIPINDPSMINNEFDVNLFSLNDVERIEVCRGAQSTLYGSDAIAGVINIITTKTDVSKPFNLKATGSAGTFNTYKGNLQVYGQADKLSYTARYAKLYSDGFSSAYDSTRKAGFDKDDYNGDVANGSVKYQFTPAFAAKTYLQYSRYKSGIDGGIFIDDKDYDITNKNLTTGLGLEYKKGIVAIYGNYRYSDISRNYFNDSTDNPGSLTRDEYFGKTHFSELFANIKTGDHSNWLVGGDYRFNGMNQYNFGTYPASPWGPAGSYSSQLDSSLQQASVYASIFANALNKKLNVELGGRLNVHSSYGTRATYTFNPSYSFNEHWRAFGSIASAFKTPTLYQLYSSSGNADLKAETAVNYEMGLQQVAAKTTARLVYFYRKTKNGIDYNYLTYQYFNYLEQTAQGIEAELSIQPVDHLNITANYTYLDVKELTQSREDFSEKEYPYVLRRPKHNVNINIGYQFTPSLYASVSGKYVSKRKDAGGYMAQDVDLDAYFLLGAYAEYQVTKNLKLFADFKNITNKKFFDLNGYNAIPFMMNAGFTFSL